MERQSLYAVPNVNMYAAAQLQQIATQRIQQTAGMSNFPGRPDSFPVEKEHPFVSSKAEGQRQWSREMHQEFQIRYHLTSTLKANQFKGINDKGMPMHRRPFMKGKLYIHFIMDFPNSLPMEQCKALEVVSPPRCSMHIS
ncbi:hypothetical protein LOK49_LG07G01590 [Camellia lanceoleosa]|uniref:Uncharacterized protein n=1 Tax=Camellia lanceoleosa TaxID=1840588 RepID=A0ACC0H093_9ERIC|nr:hypothetical protein LOK49_Contig181G00002 [Camellia lanceoleosa]KAI8006858.1 hypothetical protein LOK49_LG07G01590 [Camellia lanceoleosa]